MFRLRVIRLFLLGMLWLLGMANLSAQAPLAPSGGGMAPPQQEDIRGPKAMVDIPVPKQAPVILWLSIGGGALALAIAWLWWRRNRRRQPSMSPAETALASLDELAATRDALAAEAFAMRVTQAVREYVAGRFGLAAPRRTSEEFLREFFLENGAVLTVESDALRVFLKSCDMVKFAGERLDLAQRDELLQAARGFVTATAAPAAMTKEVVP